MKSIFRQATRCLLPLAGLLLAIAPVSAQIPGPTEAHKILAEDVGTWDAELTMYIPGVPEPLKSTAVETNTLFADGLWVLGELEGEVAGQKFSGRGQFGYDPVKEKYVGTWIDSMTPHLATMEGDYDAKTKTLTMMMTGTGPDGKPMVNKAVTTYLPDGRRTYSMFEKGEGDEWNKMLEVVYTKR